MSIWEDSLHKEEWYKETEEKLNHMLKEINEEKTEFVSFDNYLKLIESKVEKGENIYEENEILLRKFISYFEESIRHLNKIVDYYIKFYNKNPDEHLGKDIDSLRDKISKNNSLNNRTKDLVRKITYEKESIFDLDFSVNNINGNSIESDLIYIGENDSLIISNEYEGVTFDTIIENTGNEELRRWYEFLKELYNNPYRNFFLNENTVCNFKIVFRNPKTGLYTDKEPVVQISHST